MRATLRRLLDRRVLACVFLLAAYPATVLGYVYWNTLTSGLPGGRNGPQDAYRHALASAVVAYTLSPVVVALVTEAMERGNSAANRMDRRNNAIGAAIGASATSLWDANRRVLDLVLSGDVDAPDMQQVTWLRPERWRRLPI